MARNPEHQFIPTEPSDLITEMVAMYEAITKTTVQPASPERLFIQWVAT